MKGSPAGPTLTITAGHLRISKREITLEAGTTIQIRAPERLSLRTGWFWQQLQGPTEKPKTARKKKGKT